MDTTATGSRGFPSLYLFVFSVLSRLSEQPITVISLTDKPPPILPAEGLGHMRDTPDWLEPRMTALTMCVGALREISCVTPNKISSDPSFPQFLSLEWFIQYGLRVIEADAHSVHFNFFASVFLQPKQYQEARSYQWQSQKYQFHGPRTFGDE